MSNHTANGTVQTSAVTALTQELTAEMAQQLQDNVINAAVGTVGTIAGLILLVTILSNRKLRKTYVMVIGLVIGDLLSTVSHIIIGIEKTNRIQSGTYYALIRPQECLRIAYRFFYIQSIQQDALMIAVMAIERAVAVLLPVSYRLHWSKKLSWIIVISVTSYTTIATACDYLDNLFLRPPLPLIKGTCGLTSTVTKYYGMYMFLLVLVCSGTALLLSGVCIVWIISLMFKRRQKMGDKRTAHDKTHDKKQIQMIISLAAISLSQFVFMVPITITWLGKVTSWYTFSLPDWLEFTGRLGFVVNCSLTLVYYIILNTEFRRVLWNNIQQLLCCWCADRLRSNKIEDTSTMHKPTAAAMWPNNIAQENNFIDELL